MLNKVIAFSIKNKLLISLFVFTLIGYGSYQVTKLPIDAVPDITDNQVQVITAVPSLGAPDIERLITFPIEQANSNIPGIKEIRSFSRFGLSLITIVFEDDVDVYWARQQVTERLKIAQDQIPKGLGSPELAPVTTGLGEIYQYVIRAKHGYETKYTAIELRTIQDWIVRRQLLGVKGVADVSSFGGKLKQYEIAVDVNKLKSYNITINDVFTALEKNNENTGGAYIEKKSTLLYIRSEGLIGSLDDIKDCVVKNTADGTPLFISDVADVRIGSAVRYGAMTYNDEGEAAGAVVMMLKGDNSNAVIQNVKERIKQIEKTLPEGVKIEPFLDRSKMVNSAIKTVTTNLIEGALIVILILVLFLGNLRAGFIVASVIPLSMLFAIILMNVFGVSGNLMSLGALDFGLIVDGAVIIVEACMFQLFLSKKKSLTGEEMDQMVYTTSTRMRNAAVFGELIILAVYLPIFTLEGIEGKMFKPMAQTVAFALLGAFILSLTYVPMMSALLLKKEESDKKNISQRMMEKLEGAHQKTLKKVLNFPKLIIGLVISLLVLAFFLFSRMGGEFIPDLPEGDFAVETRVLTGSNLNTTVDACLKGAHILKNKFPEVEKVIAKIGSGEIPTDPMPMEAADLMIILKDKSEWTSASSWDELSAKMSEALEDLPGVTFGFQYPVAMRFNELMSGAKQDVVCKIYGENLDTLTRYSKRLGRIIGQVEGAKEIYVETIGGLPQLVINYKRKVLAQYGMNISDINKIVHTAFAGQSSGQVFEDEKRFDLVVRLAGENRQNLEDVQNLLIPTAAGLQIPLYQVADVSIQESVHQIQRDDAKRRVIIGFNVKDRDVQSIVNDLQDMVGRKLKLPVGYYVTYGGTFENLRAAKKRLSIAVPISLLLIFFLLYFAFHSIKQGLLIFSAIPLSAIGGVFFLSLRGMPFSISAGIGFIALFGVAVLNGIVLLSEFNRIRKEGEIDTRKIVLEGTKHRLRPVLMTALVASLGFLPMALSNGAGAEVQRPLATVVIGGLLLATFLTLFVLPLLYIFFEKGFKKEKTSKALSSIFIFILSISVSEARFFQSTKGKPITIEAAIDTALKNNLNLKNEKLKSEYNKKMKASAINIPLTNIGADYGQLNSIYNDTKFGISQEFQFPKVYIQQKRLQDETFKLSLLEVNAEEAIVKKRVRDVFYNMVYLGQKIELLRESDTVYAKFQKNADLRFEKGLSNVLEKATAENQRIHIANQLKVAEQDLERLQWHFQILLNTEETYIPESSLAKLSFGKIGDNTVLKTHPILQSLDQRMKISSANTQLQKSKLLPSLHLAYNNTSIRGMGADDVFYSQSKRFNSIHFGLGVPLFFGSQQAKIDASKTLEALSQNAMELGLQNLRNEFEQAAINYRLHLAIVQEFEKKAIPNTEIILKAANLQYRNGEINYLEWTMHINHSIGIRAEYADAIFNLNQSIIQLNYLYQQ